jgi:DNA adenine methylase
LNFQYSPLRYPGGKAKIAPFLNECIKNNDLSNCCYIEPFAGGAGAALDLLFNEHVNSISINDADRSIYSFWYSVINYTDKFIKKIYDTPITIEEWKKQKKVFDNKKSNLFNSGFAAFFMNRCNVSGILSGGVIGGLEQRGNWKIDARMNKDSLTKKIERISLYADRINVYNNDWKIFLDNAFIELNINKTFIYLDPPYYKKGQDLYMNYFVHKDHVLLEEYLRDKDNWVLTYDFSPEIIEIYKKYRKEEYYLNYSARTVRRGKELVIFSKNMK